MHPKSPKVPHFFPSIEDPSDCAPSSIIGILLEEVLVEFKFGGFFGKIRQGFATIGKSIKGMVSSLLSKVVDGVGNFFDVLKKKPATEMIDGLGLGISGTIKLP